MSKFITIMARLSVFLLTASGIFNFAAGRPSEAAYLMAAAIFNYLLSDEGRA